MRQKSILTGIFLLFLLLLACPFRGQAQDTEINQVPAEEPIEVRGLHLVLVPEKNVFEQRRRYRYITDYLSKKTGIYVYLDIMPSYGQICDAFLEGNADAGFFGSFSYVLTHAKAGVVPIARPVWPDGKSTDRAYIFVRKDSGITCVEDMKGKSLALVDRATIVGYIFQQFYFQSFGIEHMEDYFSKIYLAGSNDASAWAVYTKEADVGGGIDHIYKALGDEYPDFAEQMTTLVESPPIPSTSFAVRSSLSPALTVRLKELLLNLHESAIGRHILQNFGAMRFIETTDEDFRIVYQMVNKMNIDLESYPYNN